MSPPRTLDVAKLIDERPLTLFNVAIVAFSFCIILWDGYDISAIAFSVPHIVRDWNITDRAVLGPVFSASLFGILLGSPLFGYVGDRFGRKVAIAASCFMFGVFTWAAAAAHSLNQLFWLRALAGFGLGGLLPNLIALNGEYAPRRLRATLIIVMFCGITLGGAIPAGVSVWLVPTYGWQVIFEIGGILPILMAVGVVLWMPESVKFLVLKPHRRSEALRTLRLLAPQRQIDVDTQLVVPGETVYAGFSPKHLFADGLAPITVLLWLCFAINLMGYYFLLSWMPTLLTGEKLLTQTDAATAGALMQVGGTLGGLLLMRPMETKAFLPVVILFFGAIPSIALVGAAAEHSSTMAIIVMALCGFCILGLQFGLNAASAMIYPTSVRSNGSGWAFGIGRFGSILGPILGGLLIQMKFSVVALFLIAAVPYVVGAFACLAMALLYFRQFHGPGFGDRYAVHPAG